MSNQAKRGWREKLATRLQSAPKVTEISLQEVVDNYDIVKVAYGEETGSAYLVVADRPPPHRMGDRVESGLENLIYPPESRQLSGDGSRGAMRMVDESPGKELAVTREGLAQGGLGELGTSSPSPFTSFTRQEYNPALRGFQGLQKYDQMRRSDATVRGTLRLVKTPALAGHWFIEPAGESQADQKAADFVWKCLTEYMSIGFMQMLTEALLMCDFGYYMFEKVWDIRIIEGQPRIVWKKLAPRHPMDVADWHYDPGGGPMAVEMYPPSMDVFQDNIIIPIDKLLVFSFDREAGNLEGISVLRSAYKHWYYKEQFYKIDAIQKERHGIGVPVIKLPPNYNDNDKRLADELGRNIRTNERAHITLPPQWEFMFAKLEGNPVNVLESIDHHDGLIEKNILATFVDSNRGPGRSEDQSLYLKSARFVAEIVAETFNVYGIPQLVDYNFSRGLTGYPRLRVRRVGEQEDWRTMSFSIRNLVGAGVITPDERLENYMRKEMDLPPSDPSTRRDVTTPQNPQGEGDDQPGTTSNPANTVGPPRVGPPRQAPPGPRPAANANAGRDRSGGS